MSDKRLNFCTYFDSSYIHKGLALYESLSQTCEDFHLYVMAFDEKCYEKLVSLGLKHMSVDYLIDHETPELIQVKPTRTKIEYYLTCGPSVVYDFITRYDLPDITYLDSDLFFINNPQIAFDEIAESSVAITKHFLDDDPAGEYCVQFMYFKNDFDGIKVLKWWRDSCIDWCYARYEDNKYADQKYLETFPSLTDKLCIIENRGVGLAPWNMYNYSYFDDKLLYKSINYQQVFFHMHGTIFNTDGSTLVLSTKNFDINKTVGDYFFYPYLKLMMRVYKEYLGISIERCRIQKRPSLEILISNIKHTLKHSNLVRYIVYKVLKFRNRSHEGSKL